MAQIANQDRHWYLYLHYLNKNRNYQYDSWVKYCELHGINISSFQNFRYFIGLAVGKEDEDLIHEYKTTNINQRDFCSANNITIPQLRRTQYAVEIQGAIQKTKKQKGIISNSDIDIEKELGESPVAKKIPPEHKKEIKNLSFISVPNENTNQEIKTEEATIQQPHTKEVVSVGELEIIVTDGVKLSISHDTPPAKLITIIELIIEMKRKI